MSGQIRVLLLLLAGPAAAASAPGPAVRPAPRLPALFNEDPRLEQKV